MFGKIGADKGGRLALPRNRRVGAVLGRMARRTGGGAVHLRVTIDLGPARYLLASDRLCD
jgi:hypothetical protein